MLEVIAVKSLSSAVGETIDQDDILSERGLFDA